MKKLIAQLEAATEGSRELDVEVYRLVDPIGSAVCVARWGVREFVPHYTTSIDEALTLVSEGWGIGQLWEAVNPKERPWWGVSLRRDEPYRVLKILDAPTPAIALCIAAIKARAEGADT